MIVGTAGQIGSGNDAVVTYISTKWSIPIFSIGDIARQIVKKEGLPLSNKTFRRLVRNNDKFGRVYFIKETIKRIKHEGTLLITGIGAPTDIIALRKYFHSNFILIFITAMKKTRFQRLLKRRGQRDSQTWQEFL